MRPGEPNGELGAHRERSGRQLLPGIPGLFLMTNSFETGGSERQFALLAGSLNSTAFRVHLGCIQRRGAFLNDLDHAPEFPLGGSLYGAKSFWTRLRLAHYLHRNNIAVAHAFDFYTNLTLIPAARLAGVPVVIGSQRQLGDLLSHSKSRAQAALFRWCDAVVCNSRAAADQVVEQGMRESRVVVIGNGLPASAFSESWPLLPRRSGVPRVGMIARMNSWSKNHKAFLRVAARLGSRFPNLECPIVGDGPLRPELEREAESLGLKDCVFFLGDRQDISAVLASLDVSVLPSSSESLSNVILESMAAGVPVVASRAGGNPELITPDRGILVAPDDDKALADAIKRLLLDAALRANLARNAKRFAQANFTLEHMRDRYQELYADLLERKNWRPNRDRTFGRSPRKQGSIRVALVAASPRYVGGQSVQADLLVRHWQGDPAIEARFIPIDPPLPRSIGWLERIPFLRTLVREPVYLFSLWRGLKDVEVAHIFSASYWSFLVAPLPAWFIARLRGTKTVVHYHSGEARDHLRRFRGVRSVLEDSDRLVAPSRHLADVFGEFGLETEIVPNIVDLTQFSFRERKPLRPKLVCTRGFHRYYGIDVVVRAFAHIQRCNPDAQLDLVGRGRLEPQIRNLVQELQLSGVSFSGALPHPEVARSYDAADIFINASTLDNMPVSILEAFASGTPVITTAPQGMSCLVEHARTGLLSEPGDARALAENVMRLLKDPELASRLARNARQEMQRYSWETVRQQWLEIYRSLVCSSAENCGEPFVIDQIASTKLIGRDRIRPESWGSPSTQTRNQSSRLSSRQMRSE
jgi:glycosyltransferase involved in cell wall biosynthesis